MPATTPGTATAVAPCMLRSSDDRRPREEIQAFGRAGERIVGGIRAPSASACRSRRCTPSPRPRATSVIAPPRGGAAHPRLDDAEGERRRDRRVDGVAAGFQHGRTGFRGAAMLRGDHAAARRDHRLADDLRIGKVIDHVETVPVGESDACAFA